MNPEVSIIIPTYNGQKFIGQSIESCLNQTYQNIELIIVDDASTDGTLDIIRHYAELDSRIKIITNKVNKKLPESLNIGHKASTGEFITWTSDDNYYLENAIQAMVQFLQDNEDTGMVYCDYLVINSEGEFVKKVTVPDISNLSNYNCIGACFLYRRSVFKRIGYYSKEVLYAEDYDYWLRIASRYKLSVINEQLYFYRIHDQSLTSQVKTNKIRQAKELALSRNLFNLPWVSKEEKFEKCISRMKKAISRRDIKIFSAYFTIALRISPYLTMLRFLLWVKRENNEE